MADALKTAVEEKNISIHEVKHFDTADASSIRALLKSLSEALDGSGNLISTKKITFPKKDGSGSEALYPASEEKLSNPPPAEERKNEIYLPDVVQLLNDAAYWLIKQNNEKVLSEISDDFRQIAESKHGFLSRWGAIVNNGQNISNEALEKHKADIPELLNYLQHLTTIHFDSESEEETETDTEVKPSESAPEVVEPPKETIAAGTAAKTGQESGAEPQIAVDDIPHTDAELEQKQKIQYEATWIYNRAVHEFFISHGINYSFLANHPEMRDYLLSETIKLLENKSPRDLELLFANPKRRLEILDDLYLNLSRSPQFISQLNQFYTGFAETLPENKRGEFVESFRETVSFLEKGTDIRTVSDDHLLREELSEVLGTDSPTVVGVGTPEYTRVLGSVQLAVDALILNHGVGFDVVGLSGEDNYTLNNLDSDPHNAVWLIQKMSNEHLQLMLGIPADLNLTPEAMRRLRQIIIRYATMRAIQLAQENENLKTSKGINTLSEEDAKAIAAHDTETVHKALLTAHQSTSEAVQEHGAEVVSNALVNNVKKQKAKEFVQWNLLSQEEKDLIIFDYLGYSKDDIIDFNQPPDKVHLFNLQALMLEAQMMAETQAELERQQLARAILQQEMLRAFAYEREKAVHVENVRQHLIAAYLAQTETQQQAQIMERLAYEEEWQLRQEASLYEVMAADEAIQAEGYQDTPSEGGLRGRISGSIRERLGDRFGGRFKGVKDKFSAKKKALNALKSTAGKALDKAAMGIGSAVGGPIGAKIAQFATNKKTKKWFWGGAGALGGAILAGWLKILQGGAASVGGLLAGGLTTGGLLLLGAASWPVALAAGIGIAGLSALGIDFAFGGGGLEGLFGAIKNPFSGSSSASTLSSEYPGSASPADTFTPQSTAAAGGAAETTATSLGSTIVGQSIGFTASIAGIAVVAISSLTVLFIIQGAFLVTLPNSLSSRSFEGTLGSFEGCWPTTGSIFAYENYPDGGAHAVSSGYGSYVGPGVALDIETWSNPQHIGINPPIYTPYSGVATFYPNGSGSTGYGNYVVVDTGDFALIFGHMFRFPDSRTTFQDADTGETITISPNQVTSNVQVRAGDYIGTVNDTGNSEGHHLHYEVIGNGTDIIDIVPLTESERQAARDNEASIRGIRVSSEECSRSNIDDENDVEGYIAIGPQTPDNLVVSESSMTQSPTHPCTWYGSNPNLTVATNANFYNIPTQPIGPAGSNPVMYYANADNRPPGYMAQTMRYLGINLSGSIEFGPVREEWYNAGGMPFNIPDLTKAVTGVSSFTSEDGRETNRIAIGVGNVNGQCTDFTGSAFLIGAMRDATYADLSTMMTECGAEEFMFLDGGGSGSFCSQDLQITGSRNMPVNVGLNEADVEAVLTNGGDPEAN